MGQPEHPTIVLLHGLRGFSATWRTLAAAISTQFHLVALDQRGRGDSDWDPDRNYYTDAYLADLSRLVMTTSASGNFFLLGHLLGGSTAYVYADRHPTRVRALIIEDIAPGSSTQGAGAGADRRRNERAARSFPIVGQGARLLARTSARRSAARRSSSAWRNPCAREPMDGSAGAMTLPEFARRA